MSKPLRFLRVTRLSVQRGEAQTGIEKQDEAVEAWANSLGHTIIATTKDTNVSGTTDPFERPDLGPWLTNPDKMAQYDGIVASKLDRFARSTKYFAKLLEWGKDNHKVIRTLDPDIDFSTPTGQLIGYIISWLAEQEVELIRGRVADTAEWLRNNSRWGGYKPPFGYQQACLCHNLPKCPDAPNGKGWKLVVNFDQAEIVREAAARVLKGESVGSICRDFTARRIDTGARVGDGSKMSADTTVWHGNTLSRILRSPTMKGYVLTYPKLDNGKRSYKAQIVRTSDGMPLRAWEPILDDDTWDRLQAELHNSGNRQPGDQIKVKRYDASMLLGIVKCPCGNPYYQNKRTSHGGSWDYYRVATHGKSRITRCKHGAIRQDALEAKINDWFTTHSYMLTEKRLIPGDDNSRAIAETENALSTLDWSRDDALDQARSLKAHLDDLKSQPQKPPQTVTEVTGKWLHDVWPNWTSQEKRKFMLDHGIEVTASRVVDEHGWPPCDGCGEPSTNKYGTCVARPIPKGQPKYECWLLHERRRHSSEFSNVETYVPTFDPQEIEIVVTPGELYETEFYADVTISGEDIGEAKVISKTYEIEKP